MIVEAKTYLHHFVCLYCYRIVCLFILRCFASFAHVTSPSFINRILFYFSHLTPHTCANFIIDFIHVSIAVLILVQCCNSGIYSPEHQFNQISKWNQNAHAKIWHSIMSELCVLSYIIYTQFNTFAVMWTRSHIEIILTSEQFVDSFIYLVNLNVLSYLLPVFLNFSLEKTVIRN